MEKIKTVLKSILIDFDGERVYHIGSTAYKGTLGQSCIDFAAVVDQNCFDDNEFVQILARDGWIYYGTIPNGSQSYNRDAHQFFVKNSLFYA